MDLKSGDYINEVPEVAPDLERFKASSRKDDISYRRAAALVRFLHCLSLKCSTWAARSKDGSLHIDHAVMHALTLPTDEYAYVAEVSNPKDSSDAPEVVTLGLVWDAIINGGAQDPAARLVSAYRAIVPGASNAEALASFPRIQGAISHEAQAMISDLVTDASRKG